MLLCEGEGGAEEVEPGERWAEPRSSAVLGGPGTLLVSAIGAGEFHRGFREVEELDRDTDTHTHRSF